MRKTTAGLTRGIRERSGSVVQRSNRNVEVLHAPGRRRNSRSIFLAEGAGREVGSETEVFAFYVRDVRAVFVTEDLDERGSRGRERSVHATDS